MKIAVIAHAHYPIRQPFAGGLEAHTYQLVTELTRMGHDVTTYSKTGSHTAGRNVAIFRGNARDGKNPLYDRSYRTAMRKINQGKYDLIFNNSLNHMPLALHTSDMAPMITIFHTPPLPKMIAVLHEQFAIPNRTYIAVSELTVNQWRDHCADRIHAVPNGIDLTDWQAKLTKPNIQTAAWVGRITPEKGTHVAIEACIRLNLPLLLGGNVYDKKYYKSVIKPYLKNPLITYAGHVNHAQVNEIYANASVALITPLWDEPFGLVALEALGSGTPVAALANGALPSIIGCSVGSLAHTDSAQALTEAITAALTKNRAACRWHVEQNFTLAATVEKYLELAPVFEPDMATDQFSWQTYP